MQHTKLVRYLWEQGHFHGADENGFAVDICSWDEVATLPPDHRAVTDAIASWQAMRPLKVDGYFGPVSAYRQIQEEGWRCKCPDIMERRANLSEWPESCQHEITTAHRINDLTYSDAENRSIDDAWLYGITRWNEVSGVVLSLIDDFDRAKIQASSNRESSGILAWSYLPGNDCAEQLVQSYNDRVRWYWHLLWTTLCHEVGHAIGLSHGGRGIMQPAHDSTVTKLGEWDIAQAVKRYGKPLPVPPIPEPPTPDPAPPPSPPPPAVEYGLLEWFREGVSVAKFDVLPRAEVPR